MLYKLAGRSILIFGLLYAGPTWAQCPAVPNNIANGDTADASKVMQDFNHIVDCLNGGLLTVPSATKFDVVGPAGGTISIKNPSASTSYDFNLPVTAGSPGQVLTSAGAGVPAYWNSAGGSVAPPIIDGIPISRPSASALAWRNQGNANLTEYTNGPITLNLPAQYGDQIRGVELAPPSTPPYSLTAKLGLFLWGSNYYIGGVYIADTAGKIITFEYLNGTIEIGRWNSVNSHSDEPFKNSVASSSSYWFRVTHDGTNLVFYISPNGADWMQVYSEPATQFLGSNIAALGVQGNMNSNPANGQAGLISIWSLELVGGSGTNSHW